MKSKEKIALFETNDKIEMKKTIDVGCHSVRLNLLIPDMYFILRFREARAEFRARK